MIIEKVLVNVAVITQKLRGFRVYNEQANTSLLCSVNSCVMTYLDLQEIWWEEKLVLISFLCFVEYNVPLSGRTIREKRR
jgi:hypothetical protein